jgi:hypothetical protein
MPDLPRRDGIGLPILAAGFRAGTRFRLSRTKLTFITTS